MREVLFNLGYWGTALGCLALFMHAMRPAGGRER